MSRQKVSNSSVALRVDMDNYSVGMEYEKK